MEHHETGRETGLPGCSIIIVGYNSAADLPVCLDALTAQSYPALEIILVDNASQDETERIARHYVQQYAQQCAPLVRYLKLAQNVGFAAGNNRGADIARGEILVFLNPDTEPRAGWLEALVSPLVRDRAIGMTTSRILMADRPQLVNACGNDITWTGLTVCRGIEEPASDWEEASECAAVSGAAFAMPRTLFQELGGFDEAFFMYYEDTDLSLRARLLGYRIVCVPDSVTTHRYTFKFSAQKAYYQERNRWLALLKTLRWPTLLLLLPGLLLGEAMAWTYATLYGREHLVAKAQGWLWLLRNRAGVWQCRRTMRSQRRISDRTLLAHWSPHLRFAGTVPQLPAQVMEGVLTMILRQYGALCQRLLA